MDTQRMVAVIMAGGGGTRFWPRSRRALPKQFLAFEGKRSLLQLTVDRLKGLVPPEQILVITSQDHLEAARQHTGLPASSILGEPTGRDTAACIGWGAVLARAIHPDAVMLVLSADHLVQPVDAFQESLRRAAALADATAALVSLGLRPDRPATGYGYIETGKRIDEQRPVALEVVSFHEKPDLETARRFVLAGRFLWNSGMFAFRTDAILKALEEHLPDLFGPLMSLRDPRDAEEVARIYPELPSISIDYGVMEHAKHRLVVEAGFEWDDVGTFEAVARHGQRGDKGNVTRGESLLLNCKNTLVDNDVEGLVVVCGMEDVLVVRTGDAVLVLPRSQAQRVKEVVKALEDNGRDKWL